MFRFGRFVSLSLLLAFSLVPAAEASVTAATMKSAGYSAAFAEAIERMEADYAQALSSNLIPPDPKCTTSAESILPIRSATGMSALVNDGSLLPRRTLPELGVSAPLSDASLGVWLDALFDGSDITEWMRSASGEMLSERVLKARRGLLTNDKEKYARDIAEYRSTPGKSQVVDLWFALVNEGAKHIDRVAPSREAYRRLAVSAWSLATNLYASPEGFDRVAPLIMTQIGEFCLLTGTNEEMLKLMIGELKFFVPSPQAIRDNPVLQAVVFHTQHATAPNLRNAVIISELSLDQLKRQNAEVMQLAKDKMALANEQAALARETRVNEIGDQMTTLTLSVNDDILAYNRLDKKSQSTEVAVLKKRIEENVAKIRALYRELTVVVQGEMRKVSRDRFDTLTTQMERVNILYQVAGFEVATR